MYAVLRRSAFVFRAGLALAAMVALTACSDEPDVTDLKQAFSGNARFKSIATMAGKDIQTMELERGGCAPAANAAGFVCDIRIGYPVNGRTNFGPWGKGRFFKAGGVWNVEEMN